MAHLSFVCFVYLLVASALVCLFVKDRLRQVLLNSHMLIALCWLMKFDSVDTYVQIVPISQVRRSDLTLNC